MSRQADAAISAAVAEKQPDWSWQVAYQKRGADFGDMVSVQFSVDLPVFAGSRQDPKIAASHSARNRLDAQREAKLRQHRQQLDDLQAQYHRLDRAVERSQSQLIPLAIDKVQLSLADYRAGKNQLANLISARRELIEARLRDIDLQQQRSLVSANLHYAYTEISQ
ncbi:MAG: TolC family protein, partial [Pseudomonas marincola]|uniref:TolC family protein n=2 Tax=Pseudomonas TaxID=286 RepID=UPI00300396C8